MKYAKDKGATVVAITDSETSPIAALADFTLTAKSNMASFMDSLVAPLSLINALIVEMTLDRKDDVHNTFSELESIWDKYGVYDTEDTADE